MQSRGRGLGRGHPAQRRNGNSNPSTRVASPGCGSSSRGALARWWRRRVARAAAPPRPGAPSGRIGSGRVGGRKWVGPARLGLARSDPDRYRCSAVLRPTPGRATIAKPGVRGSIPHEVGVRRGSPSVRDGKFQTVKLAVIFYATYQRFEKYLAFFN